MTHAKIDTDNRFIIRFLWIVSVVFNESQTLRRQALARKAEDITNPESDLATKIQVVEAGR
jgi:hypothetical protein